MRSQLSRLNYSVMLGIALFLCYGCGVGPTNAGATQSNAAGARNSNAAQNSNTTPASANNQQGRSGSRADLSAAASQVLVETDQARQAVAKKNKEQALRHVEQGLQNVGRLGDRASVPIYTELERLSVIGPVETARKQQGSNGTQAAGGPDGHAAANKPAKATTVAVKGAAGGYTRIVLDVNIARDRLRDAKAALDSGNFEQANAALAAVQNGVILESVSTNLPLLRARENLTLAGTAAGQGRFREARAALKSASDALGNYTLVASVKHAGEAKELRQEIDSYAQTIEQSHADSDARIKGWWNRVADWMDEPE